MLRGTFLPSSGFGLALRSERSLTCVRWRCPCDRLWPRLGESSLRAFVAWDEVLVMFSLLRLPLWSFLVLLGLPSFMALINGSATSLLPIAAYVGECASRPASASRFYAVLVSAFLLLLCSHVRVFIHTLTCLMTLFILSSLGRVIGFVIDVLSVSYFTCTYSWPHTLNLCMYVCKFICM